MQGEHSEIGTKLALAATVFFVMQSVLFSHAQAERPTVTCEFRWSEYPGMNLKGGSASAGQIKVRTIEYNRLVDMGTVPARVAADRGQHCQLNHPEKVNISQLCLSSRSQRLSGMAAFISPFQLSRIRQYDSRVKNSITTASAVLITNQINADE